MNIFFKYNNLLLTHPLKTKSLTAGLLYGFGDFLTQKIIDKKPIKSINLYRTLKMFTVGFFVVGPFLHQWYSKVLPKTMLNYFPKLTFTPKITVMIALDQLLMSPPGIMIIYIANDILCRVSFSQLIINLKNKFWPTLVTNWKVFPFAALVNFTVIPIQFRVLFLNVLGIFWNMYISFMQYSKQFTKNHIK